jgi:hypothetical protein
MVHKDDLFGRFYLKLPGPLTQDLYFRTIDALRPLLGGAEWTASVTGYYINAVGKRRSIARLSYFTKNAGDVKHCVESYCPGKQITEERPAELQQRVAFAELYGGDEMRFREYLCLYTRIGLDMLKADLLNARCLMATFRMQVMLARKPYRPHFEKTFLAQSPFYCSLSGEARDAFWQDFSRWPKREERQFDWAHLMVNMILPGDWNHDWDFFLSPKPPRSIEEINLAVKDFGFQIPPGWCPP